MIAGVIGTGYMGKTHINILKKRADTLVICSADEQTGRALAQECGGRYYSDYEEMLALERLDFVSVCVPTYMHYPVVKAAMAHNVPVLCEKPFTLREADAVELLRSAAEKNLPLMVGHCLRFSKAYAYLKRCIADRRFGKLKSLHMYRNSAKPGWSPDNWFANIERSGGIVRDLHIHDTDMAVNLLGVPEAVYTTGNDCCCTTVFAYPGDMTVTATASWRGASGFPFSAGFDAVFENGSLVYEKDALVLYIGEHAEDPLEKETFPPAFGSDDMMENELRYFCDCLEKQARPVLCDPVDSVKTMFVSCAESRSMQKDCFEKVKIPDDIDRGLLYNSLI